MHAEKEIEKSHNISSIINPVVFQRNWKLNDHDLKKDGIYVALIMINSSACCI